jgi:hypothetical protein
MQNGEECEKAQAKARELSYARKKPLNVFVPSIDEVLDLLQTKHMNNYFCIPNNQFTYSGMTEKEADKQAGSDVYRLKAVDHANKTVTVTHLASQETFDHLPVGMLFKSEIVDENGDPSQYMELITAEPINLEDPKMRSQKEAACAKKPKYGRDPVGQGHAGQCAMDKPNPCADTQVSGDGLVEHGWRKKEFTQINPQQTRISHHTLCLSR